MRHHTRVMTAFGLPLAAAIGLRAIELLAREGEMSPTAPAETSSVDNANSPCDDPDIRADSDNNGYIDDDDDAVEEESGVNVTVNLDDDNNNGIPDLREHPVEGEDDLTELRLSVACDASLDYDVAWWCISWIDLNPPTMQIWLAADKSDPADGPIENGVWYSWPPPSLAWMETMHRFPEIDIQFTIIDEDFSHWLIQEKPEAVARAHEIVGWTESTSTSADAVLGGVEEDELPCFADEITDRSIWRVVAAGWGAPWGSHDFDDTAVGRTWDVLLDAVSGQVLTIASRNPPGVSLAALQCPATENSDGAHADAIERYHGFPDVTPVWTYADALATVADAQEDQVLVRQVRGEYIRWSLAGHPARNVWVVTLHGMRPTRSSGPDDTALWTSARYVVDAETGDWLYETSTCLPNAGAEGGE